MSTTKRTQGTVTIYRAGREPEIVTKPANSGYTTTIYRAGRAPEVTSR